MQPPCALPTSISGAPTVAMKLILFTNSGNEVDKANSIMPIWSPDKPFCRNLIAVMRGLSTGDRGQYYMQASNWSQTDSMSLKRGCARHDYRLLDQSNWNLDKSITMVATEPIITVAIPEHPFKKMDRVNREMKMIECFQEVATS